MQCPYNQICGGCSYRHLNDDDYHNHKISMLRQVLEKINQQGYKFNSPYFVPDGQRRRASFNFSCSGKKLSLGFNQNSSHKLVNIDSCLLLTPQINNILNPLRTLLWELCSQTYSVKIGKKLIRKNISGGDVFVCQADNGIDIVLEYDAPVDINARMIIADFLQSDNNVIRISHRRRINDFVEIVLQKATPVIQMGKYSVKIPAGTFLQASAAGEQALASVVMQYLQGTKGQIADLFCGVGTFSYYINSAIPDVKITAVDSDEDLLQGFKNSCDANQITNIAIKRQNLFKYPLTADEIANFNAIIFDPPRAGAKEQCRQIARTERKPKTIVAVSCNPLTFVYDANILIASGYRLQELTFVDQFTYSEHSELVALFKI